MKLSLRLLSLVLDANISKYLFPEHILCLLSEIKMTKKMQQILGNKSYLLRNKAFHGKPTAFRQAVLSPVRHLLLEG